MKTKTLYNNEKIVLSLTIPATSEIISSGYINVENIEMKFSLRFITIHSNELVKRYTGKPRQAENLPWTTAKWLRRGRKIMRFDRRNSLNGVLLYEQNLSLPLLL